MDFRCGSDSRFVGVGDDRTVAGRHGRDEVCGINVGDNIVVRVFLYSMGVITKMCPLIGITGVIGSGKDSVARILREQRGYDIVRFADLLKDAVCAILSTDRETLEDRHFKETPIPGLGGVTPRYLLRTLGTEWGRELVHTDLWVLLAEQRIERRLAYGMPVAVPDVRFPNERDMILRMGGKMLHVVRKYNPYADLKSEHKSDKPLPVGRLGILVGNHGTLHDLENKVLSLIP